MAVSKAKAVHALTELEAMAEAAAGKEAGVDSITVTFANVGKADVAAIVVVAGKGTA